MPSQRRHVLTCLAAAALPGAARAQSRYPNRPITLIVPVPPGGLTDAIARMVGQRLGDAIGQQVIVESKPGASTIIGTKHVIAQPADGYTMFLTLTQLVQNPLFFPPQRVGYDPYTDLVPVSRVGRNPAFFVVAPGLRAATLAEFVALAKAGAAPLSYATNGQGSTTHMYGEIFAAQAGITLNMIPYRGEAPMVPDLMTGRVTAAFVSGQTAAQLHAEGKARVIAVTGAERMRMLPQLPTFRESGYSNIDAEGWFGFFMRSGTPPEAVELMSREIDRIIKTPEVSERLLSFGVEPGGGSSADFAVVMKRSHDDWVRILKVTSVRPAE